MGKSSAGRKRKTNKHIGLKFKSGKALQKITGKSMLDWSHLCKLFPLYKAQIKAHKNDQDYLKQLKVRLEKVA